MAHFFPFHWIHIRTRRQLLDVSQNLASPVMAETAVSYSPPVPLQPENASTLEHSCILIILFFVIIYGSFSFIRFIVSAASFEMSKECYRFHSIVLILLTVVSWDTLSASSCSTLGWKGSVVLPELGQPDRCLDWCLGVARDYCILQQSRNCRTGFPKVMILSVSRCIFLCVHQLTSASHDATWQRTRGSQ